MKGFSLSFKARVFLGCLLVALIPLLFSSVIMVRIFNASLNRQSDMEARQQLVEIENRFTGFLDNCETVCENLTEDGAAAWNLVDNTTVDRQRDMYLSLYDAVQEIHGLGQFCVYDVGGKLRFTTDTAPREPYLPIYWGLLKKASGRSGMTFYRTDPYLSVTDSRILMQGAYSLENARGARTGYVVLDFTRENLNNVFSGAYALTDIIVLLDSHQRPFYCSRPEYGEGRINEIAKLAASGVQEPENGREHSLCLWAKEPKYGFYMILCRQAPISAPAIRTMGTVTLALSALSLILCLMITGTITRTISQPVSQLDEAMEKVKRGDLSIRIYSRRRDELGRLTESFNRMAEDLKTYLDDKVQRQKDLNETRLKLYQTQLNPHFLYNTLDTIRWSAKINQMSEIAVLAENLAVILRKSIAGSPFITLREELDTIDSYIQIQKIRFTGRFLYETEVPDQLEACMVPKMILQPLVENAILHGLDGCENGYICIYGAQKDGILRISVTDDGCGMPCEMVDWINGPNPVKRAGHLGLYNVIQILKLYYGEEYGMEAVATEDGTTVTLRLPFGKEAPDV